MLSPCGTKQRVLVRAITSLLRQATTFSSVSTATNGDSEEDDNVLAKLPPLPPKIPKLKCNAVLKALASTVTDLDHPFHMGKSLSDPAAPVTRNEQMKYLMAREAGVNAAKYVIEKWYNLFPNDFNPDLRPLVSLHRDLSHDEVWLKTLISQRRVEEAIEVFDKLEKQGKKISLDTHNDLLELLAYSGLGDYAVVKGRSQFIEHQALICDSGTKLEFIPANVAERKRGTPLQAAIDESNILLLSARRSKLEGVDDSLWTLKFPRKVWSPDNKAEKMFVSMHTRNGATYDALILGLFKYKSYDRMFKFYSTMRNAGYQASTSTYNYLLMALDHSDSPVAWDRAMELVKEMAQTPAVHPDITTFNVLLKLCERTGVASHENAAAVFQEMLSVGVEPNLTTFLRILQAYIFSNVDPKGLLLEIINYLEHNPQVLQLKSYFDLFFFEAALHVATSVGTPADVIIKLFKMASRDGWLLVGDVEKFLSAHLTTLSSKGEIERLMDTYRWLLSQQYRPGDSTYASLFQAAASPDTVLELWNDYKKFGVQMKSDTVVRHIHRVLRGEYNIDEVDNYLQMAEESWCDLVARNIRPDPLVVEGMVQICLRANQHNKAWDYYNKFELLKYQPSPVATQRMLDACATNKSNTHKIMEIIRNMIANGHPKPANYDKLCSDLEIPPNTWTKLQPALGDGGKVSVDSAARKIQSASSHKYGVIVRIRGGRNQQFTENVLVSLFQEYRLKSEDIISMFKNASGQGEAIVVFPTSQQAQQAVDEKQRKYIGKNFLKLSLKHFSYGVTVLVKSVSPNLTAESLARFFKEYDVDPVKDIMFETKQDGKLMVRNALVAFGTPKLAERALTKGRNSRLGKHYLNLSIKKDSGNYSSTDDAEVTDTVQSSNHQHFSHQGVITIHGLIPYSATEQEIADYLQDYNVCCDDVKLLVDSSDKLTGVVQVTFPSVEAASKAVKDKDGRHFVGRPLQLIPHSL